jgi:uncharacterized protein (DUF1697 family)
VTAYVALLRAVNVGGRQLKMEALRQVAADLGFESPRTFIASGNLLFLSNKRETDVKHMLEDALRDQFSAPVEVMVRTGREMAAVAGANPFSQEPGNRVGAIFYDHPVSADMIESATGVDDERLALGTREIYVHFPSGQGRSKLKLGGKAPGTARNMNTVGKLAELAREMA